MYNYYILYRYIENIYLYVCKRKRLSSQPHPSHSLPEETIVSISCGSLPKSPSHVLSYWTLPLSPLIFSVHAHIWILLFVVGVRAGVCTVCVLSTEIHILLASLYGWEDWDLEMRNNFLGVLQLGSDIATPNAYLPFPKHSGCFITERLSLLEG